jgi:hypothetical protein
VEAEAESYLPIERLQLIVNGSVAAEGDVEWSGRRATLSQSLQAEASCWIAARVLGSPDRLVFGGPLFAHTSPIYVSVAGAPVADIAAARYFVEWIDRLIALCRTDGRYPDQASRDEVIALFASAREIYERMAPG